MSDGEMGNEAVEKCCALQVADRLVNDHENCNSDDMIEAGYLIRHMHELLRIVHDECVLEHAVKDSIWNLLYSV